MWQKHKEKLVYLNPIFWFMFAILCCLWLYAKVFGVSFDNMIASIDKFLEGR